MLRRLRLIDDKELKNAQQHIRAQSQQIKMRQKRQNVSFGGGACSFFKMTSPRSSQARFSSANNTAGVNKTINRSSFLDESSNDISNLISSKKLVQYKNFQVKSCRNAKVETNQSELIYNNKITEDAMLSFTNNISDQQFDVDKKDSQAVITNNSIDKNINNAQKSEALRSISLQEESKGETSRCDDAMFGLTDPKLSSIHKQNRNTQTQSEDEEEVLEPLNEMKDDKSATQFRVIATPRGNRLGDTSHIDENNISFAEQINKNTESTINAIREFKKQAKISPRQGSQLRQIFSNAMLKYGKMIKSSQQSKNRNSPKKRGFALNLKCATSNLFPSSNNNNNNNDLLSFSRQITPLTSRSTSSPGRKNTMMMMSKRKHLPQTSCYIINDNNNNSITTGRESVRQRTDKMRRTKMKQLGYQNTEQNQQEQQNNFEDRRTILSQMLYQSPSGKLYHNADNIYNTSTNNEGGSPTHSFRGFGGNAFSQKSNYPFTLQDQQQPQSPSPVDITSNQYHPSTPGHLISFADLITKDKTKNQANNDLNNNPSENNADTHFDGDQNKKVEIQYYTTPSGVNFGISNNSKILSACTSLEALSATSDIALPQKNRKSHNTNAYKSSTQSHFIQSPTALIFRSPGQTIITKSGANLLQRIKRPSTLELYQQKNGMKRKPLFSRLKEQKREISKPESDKIKLQNQYNRRMNLFYSQPHSYYDFLSEQQPNFTDPDTKDMFVKGRKSFEKKNSSFQKMVMQNHFKPKMEWKAARVNTVEAKHILQRAGNES